MKIRFIVVVLALLALVHSQGKMPSVPTAQRPFSGTFAATWLGGFCTPPGLCDDAQYSKWDRQSFTIHGLWPGSRTNQTYGNFSKNKVKNNTSLYADMRNYWPAQSKSSKAEDWLWNHEYNKHGKDYSQIIQIHHPEIYGKASDSKLQQTYFQAGIDFYKLKSHKLDKLNISKASGVVTVSRSGDVIVSKKQLGEIIGIEDQAFLVSCQKGQNFANTDVLVEIQICFRIQRNLDVTYENCKAIKANGESPTFDLADNCLEKIKLIDFKPAGSPSQSQVTKHAASSSAPEL